MTDAAVNLGRYNTDLLAAQHRRLLRHGNERGTDDRAPCSGDDASARVISPGQMPAALRLGVKRRLRS